MGPKMIDYAKYLSLIIVGLSILIFLSNIFPYVYFFRIDNRLLWHDTYRMLFSIMIFFLVIHFSRKSSSYS
ncbi:MAG: hypothetical protein ACMXYL_05130 [Candidatus Woesearchaeota archaeon]